MYNSRLIDFYNHGLIDFYIKETNRILDMAELAEETKNNYMLAGLLSNIGFTKSMLSDHIMGGSKRGYSEKFIKDLDSFSNFFSRLTWELADLITVR